METKKIFKKVVLSLLGIFLLLFAVLVFHIATAKPLENATIQVSRIDFDRPFDSLSKVDVEKKLHSIKGVRDEIIIKRNVVVYFHDNRIADSKKVYDELMSKGNYRAERFILPAGMAQQSVCPVMKKDSYSYKFSKFVKGIFN